MPDSACQWLHRRIRRPTTRSLDAPEWVPRRGPHPIVTVPLVCWHEPVFLTLPPVFPATRHQRRQCEKYRLGRIRTFTEPEPTPTFSAARPQGDKSIWRLRCCIRYIDECGVGMETFLVISFGLWLLLMIGLAFVKLRDFVFDRETAIDGKAFKKRQGLTRKQHQALNARYRPDFWNSAKKRD